MFELEHFMAELYDFESLWLSERFLFNLTYYESQPRYQKVNQFLNYIKRLYYMILRCFHRLISKIIEFACIQTQVQSKMEFQQIRFCKSLTETQFSTFFILEKSHFNTKRFYACMREFYSKEPEIRSYSNLCSFESEVESILCFSVRLCVDMCLFIMPSGLTFQVCVELGLVFFTVCSVQVNGRRCVCAFFILFWIGVWKRG